MKTVTYSRTATVIWHTQEHAVTMLLEFTGTALRHTAAEIDVVMRAQLLAWCVCAHTHTHNSKQKDTFTTFLEDIHLIRLSPATIMHIELVMDK
jgi:hypothetical protein